MTRQYGWFDTMWMEKTNAKEQAEVKLLGQEKASWRREAWAGLKVVQGLVGRRRAHWPGRTRGEGLEPQESTQIQLKSKCYASWCFQECRQTSLIKISKSKCQPLLWRNMIFVNFSDKTMLQSEGNTAHCEGTGRVMNLLQTGSVFKQTFVWISLLKKMN